MATSLIPIIEFGFNGIVFKWWQIDLIEKPCKRDWIEDFKVYVNIKQDVIKFALWKIFVVKIYVEENLYLRKFVLKKICI